MTSEQGLKKIRHNIDEIDNTILDLLNKRAALALKTLQFKKKGNVYHPHRERDILNRLSTLNTGPLSNHLIKGLFSKVINACRQIQQRTQCIKDQQTSISIQGIAGSFTEHAALKYCSARDIRPKLHFDTTCRGVIAHITSSPNALGIIALNNDEGGLVNETISALTNECYTIIDTISYNVKQCLLTINNCNLNSITTVVSHTQALKQCEHFLKNNLCHSDIIEEDDTALAAQKASRGHYGNSVAVIASEQAAKLYGLHILKENIQTLNNNNTLFLIITKKKTQ